MPDDGPTAKQTIVDLVQDLPEDASYDSILQELVVNHMVEAGLADVREGRTCSDEEMAQAISSWRS